MPATLTAANATFHTRGIPKAVNSEVEIIVTDMTGTIVAQESNSFGPFSPNTTSGPFPIQVLNKVDKGQLHPGGSLTLNWLPDPPGAWEFNVKVDLTFSNGSNLVVDQNGVILDSAGATQVVYGL
jgi:hypothetical protein